MTHAHSQALARCADAGIDPQEVLARAEVIARSARPSESVAVRLAQLPAQVNAEWNFRSNGDQVWGIVRERHLVTIMLRRSGQPTTKGALRVDRICVA